MKARGISKAVVVLVGVTMISSVLFAAPNANSKNCSGVTTTDGATWGGSGSGPLRVSSSPNATLNNPCSGTQVTTQQDRSEHGNRIAHAFGKLLAGLGFSFDGTTWGGSGGLPGR